MLDNRAHADELKTFSSGLIDRIRTEGNIWSLPGGEILLPRVFGFCRGVKRALTMLDKAVRGRRGKRGQLFLLGEIIHNPWVNAYFANRGVTLLKPEELPCLENRITAADCVIIPAFGVLPPVEAQLRRIGCEVIDTSCGDVRRLWVWAERAVRDGYAVLIFGRARHDETIVTKSRLGEAGGKYLVLGDLEQVGQFCRMIEEPTRAGEFATVFSGPASNANSIAPFEKLAQVSQTTMLYDETMQVRRLILNAFNRRFGRDQARRRLLFEPTVCRATQDRQAAAVELCRKDCDIVIVVGGFGSSNTRHLYELAQQYAPAFFIEDASAISEASLTALDVATDSPGQMDNWLPRDRKPRIAVLAGASSPEIVVEEVLEKLAELLAS